MQRWKYEFKCKENLLSEKQIHTIESFGFEKLKQFKDIFWFGSNWFIDNL